MSSARHTPDEVTRTHGALTTDVRPGPGSVEGWEWSHSVYRQKWAPWGHAGRRTLGGGLNFFP